MKFGMPVKNKEMCNENTAKKGKKKEKENEMNPDILKRVWNVHLQNT